MSQTRAEFADDRPPSGTSDAATYVPPAGRPGDPLSSEAPSATAAAKHVADTAKGEAKGVAEQAIGSGQQVVETAKDQAAQVVSHARTQLRSLFDDSMAEVRTQAGSQQQRLTGTLRSWSDELGEIVDGRGLQDGPVSQLLSDVGDRGRRLVEWLDSHEPQDVLNEVARFARRRPAAFLALAAGLGVVAGRLARNLAAEGSGTADAPRVRPAALPGQQSGTAGSGGPFPYQQEQATDADSYRSGALDEPQRPVSSDEDPQAWSRP